MSNNVKRVKIINYVRDHYKKMTNTQLAKKLNVPVSFIQEIKAKHGFVSRSPWTEDEIRLLKENYSTNPAVFDLFPDRTKQAVITKAAELGLKREVNMHKYVYDEHVFDTINKRSASLLGITAAKAYIYVRLNRIEYRTDHARRDALQLIKTLYETNIPIYTYEQYIALVIRYPELINKVVELLKVGKEESPDIPDEFLKDFVVGYLVLGGKIAYKTPRVRFSGHDKYMKLIERYMDSIGIKGAKAEEDVDKVSLVINGDDALKMLEYIMKNSYEMVDSYTLTRYNLLLKHSSNSANAALHEDVDEEIVDGNKPRKKPQSTSSVLSIPSASVGASVGSDSALVKGAQNGGTINNGTTVDVESIVDTTPWVSHLVTDGSRNDSVPILEHNKHFFPRNMSQHEKKAILIFLLRHLYDKYGRVTYQMLRDLMPNKDLSRVCERTFGSFNNALQAAGIPINKHHNYTDEYLLGQLRKFYNEHGFITYDFFNDNKDYPSTSVIERRFGSWSNALRMANIPIERTGAYFGKTCVALDGHLCDSIGERVIDDLLYNNNIRHVLHYPYPHHDLYNDKLLLKSDFYLPDKELYIEYLGMQDVKGKIGKKYREYISRKKMLAKEYDLRILWIGKQDMRRIEDIVKEIKDA